MEYYEQIYIRRIKTTIWGTKLKLNVSRRPGSILCANTVEISIERKMYPFLKRVQHDFKTLMKAYVF